MDKIKAFLLESRREFKRVNWPTQQETIRMVGLVIGISLVAAAFLGAVDFLNVYVLNALL